MWSFTLDPTALGCSRSAFAKALTAEGFPNAEGYVPPVYLLPVFQKRIAIGRKGFPFTLTNRDYSPGLCPVTEALYRTHLMQFQPVSWNVDDEQVDMMIDAIRKVHAHAGSLPSDQPPC